MSPADLQRSELKRQRAAGINEWTFSACNDERDTALERSLDGRRLSYDEAMAIIEKHGDEIRRSVFLAVVVF